MVEISGILYQKRRWKTIFLLSELARGLILATYEYTIVLFQLIPIVFAGRNRNPSHGGRLWRRPNGFASRRFGFYQTRIPTKVKAAQTGIIIIIFWHPRASFVLSLVKYIFHSDFVSHDDSRLHAFCFWNNTLPQQLKPSQSHNSLGNRREGEFLVKYWDDKVNILFVTINLIKLRLDNVLELWFWY